MDARVRRRLRDQAARTEETFRSLEAFVRDPSLGAAERFENIYDAARAAARDVEGAMAGLRPEFRGCAFRFARALEGMSREARAVVGEMRRWRVASDRYLRDMARGAREGCGDLAAALSGLRSDPGRAGDRLVSSKRCQRRAGLLARRATALVLRHPNAVEAMKAREVYRHFLEAAARGDEAAELVGDMLAGAS